MKIKKILFICKWNRFRSKFAEAYFNKINKNSNFKAKSVGMLEVNVPMKPKEIKRNKWVKKKFGIKLSENSKGINVKDLDEAYKIVVVADDVPVSLLSREKWKKKMIIWKIKDEPADDKENINKIVKILKYRIKKLIKELEKEDLEK